MARFPKEEEKPIYIPHSGGVLTGLEIEISGGFVACQRAKKWCDDNDINYTYVWAEPPFSPQGLNPPTSILFSFKREEDKMLFILGCA